MKWQGREGSDNIEDRRGGRGKMIGGLGAGGVIIAIIIYFLGGHPGQLMNALQQQPQQETTTQSAEQDALKEFVSVTLKDTEDVWEKLFRETYNREYVKPTLVLFTESDQSGCGFAQAATGPFYCPADSKVYLDLSFFNEMKTRFKAPGDFAMAYVIAHEVGHHVQHLNGTSDKVHQMQQQLTKEEANELSVRLELQADFYAGVWAYHAQSMKNILEAGDVDEALNAANAIGDDRLQMEAQGYVVPDAFTHGTSEQRMYWFKKGFETGDMSLSNTFESEI